MANIDKVSAALAEWGYKVAKDMLPQLSIPAESGIGHFMYGILGINPASYNVWNELGFLAEPLIQTLVTPAVGKMLAGIPDEQVPELAQKFADAFIKRAEETGGVNLFGIVVDKDDLLALKAILTDKIGG